jgi:hypothetical protein
MNEIIQLGQKIFLELKPLLFVLFGWLLNEFSSYWKLRREDKKAIGECLALLLDIRHRFFRIEELVELIKKKLNLPDEYSKQIYGMVKQVIPKLLPDQEMKAMEERYAKAVSQISSVDPLLGFELQSKNYFGTILEKMRSIVTSLHQDANSFWETSETNLLKIAKKEYERVILSLAWNFGIRTYLRTRRTLKKPFELPKEIDEYLTLLKNFKPPTAP